MITRQRTELLMRICIGPVLTRFAKTHFPEIKKPMLRDLTAGVADYIANSFESYQDDLEADKLADQNEINFNQRAIPLEKCTIREL